MSLRSLKNMVLQNIVIRGVLLVFVEKKPELTYGILHQEGCGMSRPSGVTECLEVQVLKAVAVLLLGAQVGPEGRVRFLVSRAEGTCAGMRVTYFKD